MTHAMKLTFMTDEGKKKTISIPRADVTATDYGVKSAMTSILSTGIVTANDGNLVSAESAKLQSRDVYEFTF